MYLLGEQPEYVDSCITALQALIPPLLADLPCSAMVMSFDEPSPLTDHLRPDHYYLVEAGQLQILRQGRSLFYLQEGDLLGLHDGHPTIACHYLAEPGLKLRPYARDAVLSHIADNRRYLEALLSYLGGQSLLLADAICRYKPAEVRSSSGFKRVPTGEVLITQGDDPDHVFVIIDGHAEVFVAGHKVGDVGKDEIFGALALFTGQKRNATVVASEPCTLMVIPKEQFMNLTQSNPRIAHSLIESMARQIDQLNRQVASLMEKNS